jgi:hypothetical protein
VYQDLAEHYGTAIIPTRVRAPKDKATVEGAAGIVTTYILAAIRNQQFFTHLLNFAALATATSQSRLKGEGAQRPSFSGGFGKNPHPPPCTTLPILSTPNFKKNFI